MADLGQILASFAVFLEGRDDGGKFAILSANNYPGGAGTKAASNITD